MGMSSYVKALRSKENDQYKKNVIAYQALLDAGLDIPRQLEEYFEDGFPEGPLQTDIKCFEHGTDGRNYYDVSVKDIPEGIDIIRFVNSW